MNENRRVINITGIFIWAGVALFALLFEMVTVQLVSLWFFVGALVAMLVSCFDVSFTYQFLVFLATSLMSILFLRKWAIGKLKADKENISFGDSCTFYGKRISLLFDYKEDDEYGVVSINGVFYNAITKEKLPIKKGTKVEVIGTEGNKIIFKTIK